MFFTVTIVTEIPYVTYIILILDSTALDLQNKGSEFVSKDFEFF